MRSCRRPVGGVCDAVLLEDLTSVFVVEPLVLLSKLLMVFVLGLTLIKSTWMASV